MKFIGEGLDDIGGGYSDSISEMMSELQSGALPLLIPTPNGRDHVGVNQDCFIINPACQSDAMLKVWPIVLPFTCSVIFIPHCTIAV